MDRIAQKSCSHEGLCCTRGNYSEMLGSLAALPSLVEVLAVSKTNLNDVNFHKIRYVFPDFTARNLSFRKVNWDRKVDIIASRRCLSLVTSSSSSLIRGSDVLEAPIIVILRIGFGIEEYSKARLPWKAVEHNGSIVEGIVRGEGEGSSTCRRNWASSPSSWRIFACSLRRLCSSIFRSAES